MSTSGPEQTSVFLGVPRTDWVCSNELAFAIRDRFPVSRGHTLVITKRVTPNWFTATSAERAAVMELVDRVRAQLDQLLPVPDGYNVGFNAGVAAGQTVPHLHVHVIPRYLGDMDDPRGGVRHVIPSKGNYLVKTASLATGGDDPFSRHVIPLIERADEIAIVAAFVQSSGLERIRTSLDDALRRGAHVRLLTGDYLNITQADALQTLLDWIRVCGGEDHEYRGQLEASVIEVVPPRITSFHPKSWRFEARQFGVAFVGSSNLSRSALESGIEWNLRVDRDRDQSAYTRIKEAFEELWQRARPLDSEWVARYAQRAQRVQLPERLDEIETEPLEPPPEPHDVQRRALEALRMTRQKRNRAIVVLATGLGKTWLAAFDYAQLAEQLGRLPRLLFVAHRAELLQQASRTYRRLLRSMDTTARVGWFFGDSQELDAQLVFASVSKLSRVEHLAALRQQQFDYVVIDEVHHAAADSYRRIIGSIDPTFLLGLTATPDRADSADILGLFDDNVAFRADIAQGIELKRLAPFHYFGVKDEIDYTNIPWKNRRFEPDKLALAVETEARMASMWKAWQAHQGTRTLVFCCSIAHAVFVRQWLQTRGVRCAAVFAGEGSDDRELSLRQLEQGTLDAVCAVDVFNEGIDVPSIDRVVMLRPTESGVVFLQQLGRGLRASPGKAAVNVIDFVGNHRVFIERLRALLSFGGQEGANAVQRLLDLPEPMALPAGCSVEVELEAKEILSRLFKVSGVDEVERAYRQLVLERGADEDVSLRPSAGELQRMGFSPKRLRERHGSWFDFVRGENGLTANELRALDAARAFLLDLEVTEMTKCFKMVTLEVLLEGDALFTGMPLDRLAKRAHAFLRRSPELRDDLPEELREPLDGPKAEKDWLAYWKKNPIAAWTSDRTDGRRWFAVSEAGFQLVLPVDDDERDAFVKLVRELVDYRLAQYRDRKRQVSASSEGFSCRVLTNQRDPILKLPARDKVKVPEGETDVRLPDGSVWQFRFATQYCNVARPAGTSRNQLPDLMRTWFGPRAGQPGSSFLVNFRASPDGLWAEPHQAPVIELAARRRIAAYPDLRAAAGHALETVEAPNAEVVELPLADASPELFAVRVTGSSMDGGKSPLRDGDWAVMRLARSASASALDGRVVLIQVNDRAGAQYQIKRLVREGAKWRLMSDNPHGPTFETSADTTAIAKLETSIRPEDLGPQIGSCIDEAKLGDAFGLPDLVTRSGRHSGHLMIFVNEKGILREPDRLRFTGVEPRSAETAFVLAQRESGDWRYLGVARQTDERYEWALPPVDFETWRRLGAGREVSRRVPNAALARAQQVADAVLDLPEAQRWLTRADGRKARVLGRAQQGGLRVDGGDDGFSQRTVSLQDLAWVSVAAESVAAERGLLDEQRVNRLRYLDGTPRESTRWIDTGWAIAAWNLVAPSIRQAIALDSAPRKMRDSTGKEIDAVYRLETVGDSATIVFESRGGARGSGDEQNTEYAKGLEELLRVLKESRVQLVDVLVDSERVAHRPVADRRVQIVGESYPLTIGDPSALRKRISAGAAKVGRTKGAKGGGNPNKRLRLFTSEPSVAALAARLGMIPTSSQA